MNNEQLSTIAHMDELEEPAAAVQLERQWLVRVCQPAQAYLDQPSSKMQGKLQRLLDPAKRHTGG